MIQIFPILINNYYKYLSWFKIIIYPLNLINSLNIMQNYKISYFTTMQS